LVSRSITSSGNFAILIVWAADTLTQIKEI